MEVALIPPIAGLHVATDRLYHLVLSHMLSNLDYSRFYEAQAHDGKFIILDNSAHEHGVGQPVQRLLEQAKILGADEVVLPDRLFFGEDTYELACEAFDYLMGPGFELLSEVRPNLMVVPQGRTEAEWAQCLGDLVRLFSKHSTTLLDHDICLTVGISKDYEVFPGGLAQLISRYVIPLKPSFCFSIHMLGWGRNLWELPDIAGEFGDQIRSIDSAKPIVYGLAGIKLRMPEDPYDLSSGAWQIPKYPRREGYFLDNHWPGSEGIIRANIETFSRAAKGW